jgi:hypothetical protein
MPARRSLEYLFIPMNYYTTILFEEATLEIRGVRE